MSRHAPVDVRFWSRVLFLPGDWCWLWTGARTSTRKDGQKYGAFFIGEKIVYPHRFAYARLVGPIDGIQLDHRCRNKICVRPDHLRPATHKQNAENRGLARNNTSGVRGVSWNSKTKRWTAVIRHNGTGIYVGSFRELEDAKVAVVAKRNQLYTHNELDRIEVNS